MAAFNQDEFKFKSISVADVARIGIHDRLAMIDAAYHADDRASCSRMIEDLYAFFDQVG